MWKNDFLSARKLQLSCALGNSAPPTSGVLDLHRHAGLLLSSLGLEAVGFVFLLCKRKTEKTQ